MDNKYELYVLGNSKLDEKINQEVYTCNILFVWFTDYVCEGQIQKDKILYVNTIYEEKKKK